MTTMRFMTSFCGAALLALSCLHAAPAQAQSRIYCGVEVGSKGVKARIFEFGVKDSESSLRVSFSKDINTTIIASMKDGELGAAAIAETADAVAAVIKEMRGLSEGCKAFAVGSSGVALAKNTASLAEAVAQRIDIGAMDFITAEQEAEFGFISSIPKKDWPQAVLVDIGSSNTKIGYRGEGRFRAADLPYGSVSLTKKAADGGADFSRALGSTVDSTVRPALRDISSRLPGVMNRKKVFWIGGAGWSLATFMRPDQGARDFVRLERSDVRRFLGALNDRSWANYRPSAKASAKARAVFEKDSARVVEVFSRDNLLAGVSLFDAFLNDRGVDGPIYFVRSGQWIMGYAAAKFADEIWSEDALD